MNRVILDTVKMVQTDETGMVSPPKEASKVDPHDDFEDLGRKFFCSDFEFEDWGFINMNADDGRWSCGNCFKRVDTPHGFQCKARKELW